MYISLMLPIGIMMLVNVGIFILVIKELYKMPPKESNTPRHKEILSRFRGALGIVTLMGLTWAFGFFLIKADAAVVIHYLFAICNSCQGLFIFVFYCLLKSDVQTSCRKSFSRLAASMCT